jgi:hypothetical protein
MDDNENDLAARDRAIRQYATEHNCSLHEAAGRYLELQKEKGLDWSKPTLGEAMAAARKPKVERKKPTRAPDLKTYTAEMEGWQCRHRALLDQLIDREHDLDVARNRVQMFRERMKFLFAAGAITGFAVGFALASIL